MIKKIQRVVKFNQISCLKTYIEMNNDLTKAAKIDFEKYFPMLMNNSVFR